MLKLDGRPAGDLVYGQRADCAFNLDDFQYGSYAFQARPPRVAFDVDPGDPRRAVNVRLVQIIEE